MRGAAVAALVGGLASTAAAAGTAFGTELVRLELSAAPSRGAEATMVESRCFVAVADDAARLPLSVLAAAGTEILEVEASRDGRALEVTLDHSARPQIRGFVSLPAEAGSAEEPAEILVRYRVRGGVTDEGDGSVSIAIPVVVVGDRPREARPDGFRASLALPDGLYLRESFPTGVSRAGDGEPFRVELPIVPAFVTLEASERPALLTFPRLVDLTAVALLVGLGALVLHRAGGSVRAS